MRLSSSVLTISLTAKLLAWNWFWSTLWNKRDLHWKTSWEKFWWRSQPKFCEKILTNAEQCVASLEMGPHFMTNKSSDWFGSGLALWPKFQMHLLQMPTLRFEWSLQTQWPVLWQCAASRWMQFGMNERGLLDRLQKKSLLEVNQNKGTWGMNVSEQCGSTIHNTTLQAKGNRNSPSKERTKNDRGAHASGRLQSWAKRLRCLGNHSPNHSWRSEKNLNCVASPSAVKREESWFIFSHQQQ